MQLKLAKKKEINEDVLRMIIQYGLGFASRVKNLENKEIEDWKEDKLYEKGAKVLYNNYLWIAKVTNQSSAWNESYWEKIGDELSLIDLDTIKSMVNLSDEEINSLQNLISTEIRLDKCFSSSDAYNRLLTVENNCKTFTMEQLAKKAGVAYKIVADTTGVDSTEFLYLISNGSNGYNIYAYIDGSAVKISDTNINLDDYAKLSDLNNYYDKATSDGKYATITTVDGKVDKASILSTMSSTPSDDKLLSEKAIKSELDTINTNLDDKVNKASITTTIDSSSTDTQVPSAKSIKTELDLKEDVSNKTTTINSSSTNTQYPSAKSVYDLAGNENRRGYVFNNPTYRGNTWNRVFRVNSLLSCDSGFLTVTVYSNGLCQIATFLMSKNFNRLSIKQINCGGYNGDKGQTRPIKVRIISAETSAYSFLEIYVSGTSNTNVVATYMPLSCNSVVVLNEKGSIPGGMFACEMTATHDTYENATYTSILK